MSKAKQKTTATTQSVSSFVKAIEDKQRQTDCFGILEIMQHQSGFEPKMWGPSIIGFGAYHYKYESGHEGDAPLVGFSPRKAKISLYFATGEWKREELLKDFGKHTSGKGCVYINKMADIDVKVLKELIHESIRFLNETYPNK